MLPLDASQPVQPVKIERRPGVAVRVTAVSITKSLLQPGPLLELQLIPAGDDVTVPLPMRPVSGDRQREPLQHEDRSLSAALSRSSSIPRARRPGHGIASRPSGEQGIRSRGLRRERRVNRSRTVRGAGGPTVDPAGIRRDGSGAISLMDRDQREHLPDGDGRAAGVAERVGRGDRRGAPADPGHESRFADGAQRLWRRWWSTSSPSRASSRG